jgi:hypothetical protein
MEGERDAAALPREVAAMLEGALHRMGATEGVVELWLRAEDGHVRKCRLTTEGGRDWLARFDDEGSSDG